MRGPEDVQQLLRKVILGAIALGLWIVWSELVAENAEAGMEASREAQRQAREMQRHLELQAELATQDLLPAGYDVGQALQEGYR